MFGTWEGVARAVHDATCVDAPVDARELAAACGLRLAPRICSGAWLLNDVVHYDLRARPVRQHGLIAHEVAHWALRWCNEEPEDHELRERAARYTAGALMLPRATFDRDLRASWALCHLQSQHPNASAELCARRIAELRDAVVTILDEDCVRARVGSPWQPAPPTRLTPLEREIADEAFVSEQLQRAGDRLYAHPVIDGPYRRVIIVAEASQLGLRM